MFGRPTLLVQVHLAGYAAEHLLTRRRPRQFAQELGFALASALDPGRGELFPGLSTCDGYCAIKGVLAIAVLEPEGIRSEVERFYDIARESLATVWPAVRGVAKALLAHEELDREGLNVALDGVDIYSPVFAVQRARGLLPRLDRPPMAAPPVR
jgi:hypothetical protein